MDRERYNAYVGILKDELVPAMGCTEPIAVAYAAALARQTLGQTPQKVNVSVRQYEMTPQSCKAWISLSY